MAYGIDAHIILCTILRYRKHSENEATKDSYVSCEKGTFIHKFVKGEGPCAVFAPTSSLHPCYHAPKITCSYADRQLYAL